MEKIPFNLHKGMRGNEVLSELHGKVSGETRELYQTFSNPGPHHVMKEDPLHRVIDDDGKYAIIEKIHTTTKIMHTEKPYQNPFDPSVAYPASDVKYKSTSTDRSYFLCGINDEGTYFVHPMDTDSIKHYWKTGSISSTLDVINKVEEGFLRLQGDVLMKFIPEYELVWHDDAHVFLDEEEKFFTRIIKKTPAQIRKEQQDAWGRLTFRHPDGIGIMAGPPSQKELTAKETYFDETTNTSHTIATTRKLRATSLTLEEYEKEYLKQLKKIDQKNHRKLIHPIPLFGNHFLYEGNAQVFEREGTVCIVGETELILDHNEHKAVTIQIPKEHVCILTTQRGVTAIEGRTVGYD